MYRTGLRIDWTLRDTYTNHLSRNGHTAIITARRYRGQLRVSIQYSTVCRFVLGRKVEGTSVSKVLES